MSRVRASTVGTPDRPRPMSYVDPERPGMLEENPPAPISARLPGQGGDDEEGGDDAPGGLSQGPLTRYGGQGNLADMLSSRPSKEELISRNILKDDKVSPRLQAAQEELKKKKLEDLLNKKLPHRAPVEELVQSNILHTDPGVAPSLQAAQDSLKRAQIEDEITKNLRERPSVQQLKEKEIIKPAEESAAV